MNELNQIIKELGAILERLQLFSNGENERELTSENSQTMTIEESDPIGDFIKSLTDEQLKEAAKHEYYTFKLPNNEDLTVAKSFALDELDKRGVII